MRMSHLRLVVLAAALWAPALLAQPGTIECNRPDQPTRARTLEERRRARPIPLPTVTREELNRLMLMPFSATRPNDEFFVPGGDPRRPNAMGRAERADVSQLPYADAGMLFQNAGFCTAAFTGSGDVLLTAAHCVRDGKSGQWYWNLEFYRAYSDGGGQPVTPRCVCTWSGWFNGGNPNHAYDYAFIKTNEQSQTGWLGMRTGVPYASWTSVGYPSNYEQGLYMYKVVGWKGWVGNVVQMRGNNMGSGSSGGAWIGDVTSVSTEGNYVIGVNSFRPNDDPTSVWGPYFDSSVGTLYQRVANDCR